MGGVRSLSDDRRGRFARLEGRQQLALGLLGVAATIGAAFVPVLMSAEAPPPPPNPTVVLTPTEPSAVSTSPVETAGSSPAVEPVTSSPAIEETDTPEPEVETPALGVPGAYFGSWSGVVTRTDGALSFRVQMRLGPGGLGERVGTFALPDGQCRGFVYLESVTDDQLIVRGEFTYNLSPACSRLAEVELAREGDALRYSVTAAVYGTGQQEYGNPIATGLLARDQGGG